MYQDSDIKIILEKATKNGWKLIQVTDTVDFNDYSFTKMPGGSFQIYEMTEDGNLIQWCAYLSLYDHKFAKFVFGDNYLSSLQEMSQLSNPWNYGKTR